MATLTSIQYTLIFTSLIQLTMKFNKSQFLQKVLEAGELLERYLRSSLLASMEGDPELDSWLNDLFEEVQRLLKDTSLSPPTKLRVTEFIIYLFLLGQPPIIKRIQELIYPLVRNYCQYDRDLRISKRGQEFFRLHPQYVKGDQIRKSQIRRMGVCYINFFIESVPVWAGWIPTDLEDQKTPSMFHKNYQLLKEVGLKFPASSQFVVYTQSNVDKKQAFVQTIIDDFFRETKSGFTENAGRSYIRPSSIIRPAPSTDSLSSKPRNVEGTNGMFDARPLTFFPGSSNNNFLESISSPSNQIQFPQSPRDIQVTFPVVNLHSPNTSAVQSNNVTSVMTSNQNGFGNQNIPKSIILKNESDEKMKTIQVKHLQEVSQLRMTIHHLQGQISDLKVQNIRLKKRVNQCEQAHNLPLDQTPSPRQSVTQELQRLKSQNQELKVNLLHQCRQPFEFSSRTTGLNSPLNSRSLKNAFGNANEASIYDPCYSRLSPEEQVRFKRTMLKPKQILYKDQHIEFGCVTQLLDESKIKIILVLTSRSNLQIGNVNINITVGQGVIHVEKGISVKGIKASSQQKINEWTFEPVWLQLTYQTRTGQQLHKQLILPICKLKFLVPVVSQPPIQLRLRAQKSIGLYNRSVITSLKKICEYKPELFSISHDQNSIEAFATYLGSHYRIRVSQVSRQSLKMSMEYQKPDQRSSNLLQQLIFVLSK